MCTSIKEMMVASWQKIGAIDLINKGVPDIKPGEVLVRVAASGICGNVIRIFSLNKSKIMILIKSKISCRD